MKKEVSIGLARASMLHIIESSNEDEIKKAQARVGCEMLKFLEDHKEFVLSLKSLFKSPAAQIIIDHFPEAVITDVEVSDATK
jgi:hypothetical protein